jgi:hypothetical protein
MRRIGGRRYETSVGCREETEGIMGHVRQADACRVAIEDARDLGGLTLLCILGSIYLVFVVEHNA